MKCRLKLDNLAVEKLRKILKRTNFSSALLAARRNGNFATSCKTLQNDILDAMKKSFSFRLAAKYNQKNVHYFDTNLRVLNKRRSKII